MNELVTHGSLFSCRVGRFSSSSENRLCFQVSGYYKVVIRVALCMQIHTPQVLSTSSNAFAIIFKKRTFAF